MAHKCHGNKEKLTARKKSSRQKRKAHGKKEKLTAKEKSSQQKRKAHGIKEKLTTKEKSSWQKRKAHGKKEKLTAKEKSSWQKTKACGGSKNSWRSLWLSLVFGVLHVVYINQFIQRDIHYCSLSVCSCFFPHVAKRTTRGTNSAQTNGNECYENMCNCKSSYNAINCCQVIKHYSIFNLYPLQICIITSK